MRADQLADPADARQSRPRDHRSRAAQERHRQPGQPAPRADRPVGAERLRRAIYRRRQRGRTHGLLRQVVRRWQRLGRRHHSQSRRRRLAGRHLSHGLRAHLRRLLFPDLVFDGVEPLRRRRALVPTPMPRGRSRALQLSQSGRGHRAGGIGERPALYGAAERLPLSQGVHGGLLVPQAGAELGRRAQGRRRLHDAARRRHRRHRPDREDAIASAAAQAGQGCARRRSAGRRHDGTCNDTCNNTRADTGIRAAGEQHRSLRRNRADRRPAVRVA